MMCHLNLTLSLPGFAVTASSFKLLCIIAPIPAWAGFAAAPEILGIVRIRGHTKKWPPKTSLSLVGWGREVIENRPETSYSGFQ